jgi:hypothetical protein
MTIVPDLRNTSWRKSRRSSGNNGNCVEVLPGLRGVRDSKNKDGGSLQLSDTAAEAFLASVKNGRFG